MGDLLDSKQRWLKEGQQPPASRVPPASLSFEHHYTVGEVAAMWGLSPDVIRELFMNEAGVLVIGDKARRTKRRRYVTLRIPESVVERVHRRQSNAA